LLAQMVADALGGSRHPLIRKVSRMGVTTIIIIEHVLRIVPSLVKRLIVLHHGAMLSDGSVGGGAQGRRCHQSLSRHQVRQASRG
jgi:ABC-type multidrug transport system ATPase subunit